ncbi:MAG: hypothetical protein GX298_11385 [Planctomycetes bacterium]|nr:hypothetical protein [Planctomycetota bacterium]
MLYPIELRTHMLLDALGRQFVCSSQGPCKRMDGIVRQAGSESKKICRQIRIGQLPDPAVQ